MEIIKELRKKNGLSQKELAEICGVHQTAVSQWENGRTQPDRESIKTLAKLFNASIETLLGYEQPKNENKIPVFDYITAAGICEKLGESEYFALSVTDSGMHPAMQQGDTVIISRSADIESGDIAAVAIGNGNTIIKKIIKKDTSIMLVSENTAFEPLIFTKAECETLPLFILGRATELRRKL